jgi:hypothetical protein
MLPGSHRGRDVLLLPLGPRGLFLPFFLAFSFVSPLGAQDVLTYHNDNARTGQNLNEVILTPSNVNSSQFGKLFQITVDGKVDAEPLYASAVPIPGQGTHNVVYVATEHDSVYAFDADAGTQLWQVSLLLSGETTSDDRGCGQVTPEIGITATPVIDRSSGPNGTLYAVAMSKDSSGAYHQRLHALDMTTGAEVFGGPKEIQATFPGTGDNSNGTDVIFDPAQYKERPGLLLLNQVIYTGWSSHCDIEPYTAWIIAYNESTLNQVNVLDLTPNGHEGSLWMSGAGLAADSAGNIYFLMANGTFDTTLDANGFPSQGDYGNAFVKLSTANNGLAVADYFTMSNTVAESNADADLGSGGALLLPDMTDGSGVTRHLAVGAGKDQAIYLVDRDNMGKFNPTGDNIYQELLSALPGGIWSMPAYFNGRLYYGPVGDNLLEFQFTNARLGTSPVSRSSTAFVYPGATPSISADGTLNGIVWATENTDPAVLHAYDATDLSQELYNSNQAVTRDQFGTGNKFITPMIANGKVYVGTTNGVGVFGLLAAEATVSPTSLSFGGELVGASSSAQTVTLANPGQAALAITTIAASGDFAATNDCGASLAAGANCTISVTFNPTSGGARTGTLTITDNASGGPQTVTLSGVGDDFTLSVGSGGSASATVSPGQSAMYTLSVGGEGGFTQSVNFTCTGAPTAAACTVSPGSLTPGGSASNITVTVTTTAPSFSAPRTQPLPPVLPLLPGPTGMAMLALLLGTMVWRIRGRRRLGGNRLRTAFLILSAVLIVTMAMAGCGGGAGGGGGSGTPAGSYTLTVTGSTRSGSTTLQHSLNLSLTVS